MTETAPVIAKLRDRFTETAHADEVLIMRVDSGDFLSLTGTAASTWSLIDGSRDRTALIAALASEYAVQPAEIAGDVAEFLGELTQLGLVAND